MTLKQAIRKLGGPSAVAKATGLARTTVLYWRDFKVPSWRKGEADQIIKLAQEQKEAA